MLAVRVGAQCAVGAVFPVHRCAAVERCSVGGRCERLGKRDRLGAVRGDQSVADHGEVGLRTGDGVLERLRVCGGYDDLADHGVGGELSHRLSQGQRIQRTLEIEAAVRVE